MHRFFACTLVLARRADISAGHSVWRPPRGCSCYVCAMGRRQTSDLICVRDQLEARDSHRHIAHDVVAAIRGHRGTHEAVE
jgi:hypothetical protein